MGEVVAAEVGPLRSAVGAALAARRIALVGASEDQGKFGGRILRYLRHHAYAGELYPVNPKRDALMGLKAYPALDKVPATPDLVVICVPQPLVRDVVESAGRLGVATAVVVSNGFADTGDDAGRERERDLVALANGYGLRLIGPNCMGFVAAATETVVCSSNILAVDKLPQGRIGFVSQSGAVLMAIMDCGYRQGVGFSHCVTLGNQADLELCDFVDYLIDDDATGVICTYVEGLKDPARFRDTARRAAAANKPWVMLKSGRTAAGAEAAYSHTASLAGSYAAFEAVCRENGIILMEDVEAMLCLASLLDRFPGASLRRVALTSTSGGSLALCADRLADEGIALAQLTDDSLARLHEHYPASVSNPVDIGVATKNPLGRCAEPTAEILLSDPQVDVLLPVLSTAPDVTALTAWFCEGASRAHGKPYLFVQQPAALSDGARDWLREHGVPYVDSFDTAARALRAWADADAAGCALPVETRPDGLASGPSALPEAGGATSEADTKALLARYGIKTNQGSVCVTPEAARDYSSGLQFPVVVKIVSPNITHKSDVGGVVLGLTDPSAVQEAVARMADTVAERCPDAVIEGFSVQEQITGYAELLLGIKRDPQFGPMIVIGAGGTLVELLSDVQLATAPVTAAHARRLLSRLKIHRMLADMRGVGALDIDAVADAIERLGWLAHDFRESLLELDINPLLVDRQGRGITAVDARALFE